MSLGNVKGKILSLSNELYRQQLIWRFVIHSLNSYSKYGNFYGREFWLVFKRERKRVWTRTFLVYLKAQGNSRSGKAQSAHPCSRHNEGEGREVCTLFTGILSIRAQEPHPLTSLVLMLCGAFLFSQNWDYWISWTFLFIWVHTSGKYRSYQFNLVNCIVPTVFALLLLC